MRRVSELLNSIKLVWAVGVGWGLVVVEGVKVVFCSRQLHKNPVVVLKLS